METQVLLPLVCLAIYVLIGLALSGSFIGISIAKGDLDLWLIIVIALLLVIAWPFVYTVMRGYNQQKFDEELNESMREFDEEMEKLGEEFLR
jgi:phosphotransferase system  glucose/maltose/N-acetylglucosamine-specific IIC component